MELARLQALLNVLAEEGVTEIESVDISSYDENLFEIDSREYLVLTDEEASQEFYNYQQDLIDDIGLEAFSEWARDYILDNFVDNEWFDEAMREDYELYCEDIEHEAASSDDFENRLEEEMHEADCKDVEEYIERLCNEYNSGIEWYISNFGSNELIIIVKQNNLIDWDSVIEWLECEDGRSCLASYDGVENESDDYYIYRVN